MLLPALKRLLAACAVPAVRLGAGLLAPVVARTGTDRVAARVFARHGFHLLRDHYYLPIPDRADLADPSLKEPSELVGVAIDAPAALALLKEAWPPYLAEFRAAFPVHEPKPRKGFFLVNGAYMAGDAHAYYALVRQTKPKRIVEIGSGYSTLVAGAAVLKNREETGRAADLTAIEPYPGPLFQEGIPGLTNLIAKRVQEVPLSLFTSLEAGDVLFIDSSHVLRPGGDVQREYCEILPRLAPGVLVHIHDVSLPKPYPSVYFENGLYWNEQYLLQAFLTFNARFEVVWPGTYLYVRHRAELEAALPEIAVMRQTYPLAEPSSLWMRVRPAPAPAQV